MRVLTFDGAVGRWAGVVAFQDPVLDLNVPAKEIKNRFKSWKAPKPRYTRGVLAKYAKLVSSAHCGAVTDADLS